MGNLPFVALNLGSVCCVKPFIPHPFFMNGLKNARTKTCSPKRRCWERSRAVPRRTRPLRVPRGSHAEMLPAVLGSGVMVVKCCGKAPHWRVCMPLEGCMWHDALGMVAGSRMAAWSCRGPQDLPADSWRQPGNGASEPCVGNVLQRRQFLEPFMAIPLGSVVLGR